MKTTIIYQSRSKLSKFAKDHGLKMTVRERDTKNPWMKFYASFDGVEVMSNGFLISESGGGRTPAAAIRRYKQQISRKRIVMNALRADRREIEVPILT